MYYDAYNNNPALPPPVSLTIRIMILTQTGLIYCQIDSI